MSFLTPMLGEERILFAPYRTDSEIPSDGKNVILYQLAEKIAFQWSSVSPQQIYELALKRETSLTTRLGPLLAVPHAVVQGASENRISVAVIPGGVEWDSDKEHPIRLVFMLAGGQEDHLKILSEMANLLKDDNFQLQLIEAKSPEEFMALFKGKEERPAAPLIHGKKDLSALLFEQAVELRNSMEGARLILHADAIADGDYIGELIEGKDVLVVTSSESRFDSSFIEKWSPVLMPFKGVRRSTHVQFTLLYLLGQGIIDQDDLVVNVYGKPDTGFLDSIRLSHLKRELDLPFSSGSASFPGDLELSTFARVLQIATQLALEGREGKPVGTLFVVGDFKGVQGYTRQMIANPFHGYAEEDRNILDPGIEETIKEYAKIDGAFIIKGDGTISSGGTFLSGQPTAEEMQSGLGARHAAAQGITAVSKALAVAISESTRKVTVFQSGRRVMEL